VAESTLDFEYKRRAAVGLIMELAGELQRHLKAITPNCPQDAELVDLLKSNEEKFSDFAALTIARKVRNRLAHEGPQAYSLGELENVQAILSRALKDLASPPTVTAARSVHPTTSPIPSPPTPVPPRVANPPVTLSGSSAAVAARQYHPGPSPTRPRSNPTFLIIVLMSGAALGVFGIWSRNRMPASPPEPTFSIQQFDGRWTITIQAHKGSDWLQTPLQIQPDQTLYFESQQPFYISGAAINGEGNLAAFAAPGPVTICGSNFFVPSTGPIEVRRMRYQQIVSTCKYYGVPSNTVIWVRTPVHDGSPELFFSPVPIFPTVINIFSIRNPAQAVELPPPTLLSPPDEAILNNLPRTVTLVWSPLLEADTYGLEWAVTSLDDPEWLHGTGGSPRTDTNEFTLDFEGPTLCRWRVWGIDKNGRKGAMSPYWILRYPE
jgi:hypothetical protein